MPGRVDASGALLLIQYDGADSPAQSLVCRSLCAHTASEVFATSDAADGEALMQARRMALPALERCGDTLLDDLAVPITQLPRMLRDIDAIAVRYGVRIATFGHLGDGNLHPTIIFDAADAASRELARQAFDAMVGRCIALGGSLTGEHGVGCLKSEHLPSMVCAAELDVMRRIKAAFDPHNILNPGRGL
ncbi:hypothetical protein HH308_09290 [Gordonia sp. TBRC 11910]|uniref:FAD-binding oxidoreductase/transferase type 4 C-terminal domain-containing protein n=1 Tax=Gordonia asplenii TaxID=2725283 RepID=A0A848L160_9ACTN|nr:FAD-linked oxidase C-terminal domain-containing protein [Gordonia asplenii]NMO01408.1 hypothetical protein [Gordonia asplenii]